MIWMHRPLDGKTIEDIEGKALSEMPGGEEAIEIWVCHGAFLSSCSGCYSGFHNYVEFQF